MGSSASVDNQNQTSTTNLSTSSPSTPAASSSRQNPTPSHPRGVNSERQYCYVPDMSCEACSVSFTFFKRKKCCQECNRNFCSSCLPKPHPRSTLGRQCSKCRLIIGGLFSRNDLQDWKIKDMRCFLTVRHISTKECREKHDLIELLVTHFCRRPGEREDQERHEVLVQQMTAHVRDVNSTAGSTPQQGSPLISGLSAPHPTRVQQTASSQTDQSASAPSTQPRATDGGGGGAPEASTEQVLERDQLRELLDTMNGIMDQMDVPPGPAGVGEDTQEADSHQPRRRCQLRDIGCERDMEGLTVRQLKELLVNNFVDFRGCCEKAELVQRAKRLWKDDVINRKKAQRLHQEDEAGYFGSSEVVSDQTPQPPTAATYSAQNQAAAAAAAAAAATTATTSQFNTAAAAAATPFVSSWSENHERTTPVVQPCENLKEYTNLHQPPSYSTTVLNQDNDDDMTTNDDSSPVVEASVSIKNEPFPSPTHQSEPVVAPLRSDDLCHICMDSLVDCILLECGHMVTCTQCGKRLADCPICRQYIVRVVRVFRS